MYSSIMAMTSFLKIGLFVYSIHIKPLILKAGGSLNDQPNDNGPNIRLKSHYGQSIMNWQKQYGTLKFTNAHINAVLVETWRSFQIYSSLPIVNSFNKNICCPSLHLMKTPTPKPVLQRPKLSNKKVGGN